MLTDYINEVLAKSSIPVSLIEAVLDYIGEDDFEELALEVRESGMPINWQYICSPSDWVRENAESVRGWIDQSNQLNIDLGWGYYETTAQAAKAGKYLSDINATEEDIRKVLFNEKIDSILHREISHGLVRSLVFIVTENYNDFVYSE